MNDHNSSIFREISVKCSELHRRVNDDIKKNDILYFYAPMGWGKYPFFVEFSSNYIGKDSIYWLEAGPQEDIEQKLKELPDKDGRIIIIPWLERIIDQGKWDLIWDLILHKRKKDTFLISSTIAMPEELSSFAVFYRIITYGIKDLKPSKEDVKEFFAEKELLLYEDDLLRIEKDFHNMPLCIYLLENSLKESSRGYCRAVREQCLMDVFTYLDIFFFKTLPIEEQNALLRLFCIEKLSEDVVAFMLNMPAADVKTFMQKLKNKGIIEASLKGMKFELLFSRYLRWAARRYLEQEVRSELYEKLMIYSEQNGLWNDALRLAYIKKSAKDIPYCLSMVLKGRIDNNQLLDLEKYLMEIPGKTICKYPDLMMLKIFLEAFGGNRNRAREYMNYLQQQADQAVSEEIKRDLEERIIYMKLLLPGGIVPAKYIALLEQIREIDRKGGWKFQANLGSGQLSILHGDQDFCSVLLEKIDISKSAERFGGMLEGILLNSVHGMINYVFVEILYEYNRLEQALNQLSKGYRDTEKTPRIRKLSSVKIMDILIAKNQIDSIDSFLPYHMEGEEDGLFEDNFAAHQANCYLLRNNMEKVQLWMRERAPDENGRFYVIHQYQYLIKAKVYIRQEQYVLAMMILETLMDYAVNYELRYLEMQVRILQAIIYYREKNAYWSEVLLPAVKLAEKLGFIRVFADEGAAVYEPLQEISAIDKSLQKSEWYKQTVSAVRAQMLQYPEYLAQKRKMDIGNFSDSERDIMHLLVRGEKNADIAKKLFISENTVKYHLKNIYQKLDVRSRSQAANRIRELNLL